MNASKFSSRVYITDTVKNQGTSNAGAFTVPSLSIGATSSVSNKLCYKPATTKTGVSYYVLVVDDSTQQLIESNEVNNVKATTGTVRW